MDQDGTGQHIWASLQKKRSENSPNENVFSKHITNGTNPISILRVQSEKPESRSLYGRSVRKQEVPEDVTRNATWEARGQRVSARVPEAAGMSHVPLLRWMQQVCPEYMERKRVMGF